MRFTKVDELSLKDHHHLVLSDECYYLGEYTARRDWSFSETNKLILNYKKPVSRRGRSEWKYKTQAVSQVAKALSDNLGPALDNLLLMPMPTSKASNDPEFDSRIRDTLSQVKKPNGMRCDTRELLVLKATMVAMHDGARRSVSDLENAYQISEELCVAVPNWIVIFDDVLTTGCHFRAASNMLRKRFPNARITGVFIARRVPEALDFDVILSDDE
jgi:predicted amidophosphoribosyltransferase